MEILALLFFPAAIAIAGIVGLVCDAIAYRKLRARERAERTKP